MPARKPKLCYAIKIAGYSITLEQQAKSNFIVTYGKQVDRNLSYNNAALMFGAAIMHALACEGRLDNE